MTEKIIISGAYGYGNIGDEAILSALLATLTELNPNADITVLSVDPTSTSEEHGVRALRRIEFPSGIRSALKFALAWRNTCKVLRAMRGADLYIIGGGGLFYDYPISTTAYWRERFFLYAGPIYHWAIETIAAKAMGKPVMFCALGVGPVDTRLGRFLIRHVASKADLITVRDEESRTLLDKLGLDGAPIYVTADPSVLLPPADAATVNRVLEESRVRRHGQPLIGIAVRSWFPFAMRSKSWGEEKELHFKACIAQVADRLAHELDAEIVFIPMQRKQPNDDALISLDIIRLMECRDRARMIVRRLTPPESMALVGKMDLVIGMRLHSLILAVTMNVPVVGIIYDPKVKAFLKSIGQESGGIDINRVDSDNLFARAQSVWQHREKIKQEIQPHVEILQQRALLNARLAWRLIDENSHHIV